MRAQEILPNIHWVGALDSNLRDFHGYARSPSGTTYNAYLVIDEKTTLFDTVGGRYEAEMLRRIGEVVDPTSIDYIVVNHVEMDHSGSLPSIVGITNPEKIFCSAMGRQSLLAHFEEAALWPIEVVADDQTLSLGAKTVQFVATKMLHWPDSMFSYLKEDRLLISSDAFGQNLATSERFDDEVDLGVLMDQAARYFGNIILPFSPIVRKVLSSLGEKGVAPKMIAPDHGVIWRGHVDRIIEAYDRWSVQKPTAKAVVVYDSMWGSTAKMASAIAEGICGEGLSVKLMSMKSFHHSDVMAEVLDAGAVVVGSSTLNNGIMPMMADMLTFMQGLKPRNRLGAAFGSYGWSGEAVKQLYCALEEMNMELVEPGVRVKYVPKGEDLRACTELGAKIGRSVKERIASWDASGAPK